MPLSPIPPMFADRYLARLHFETSVHVHIGKKLIDRSILMCDFDRKAEYGTVSPALPQTETVEHECATCGAYFSLIFSIPVFLFLLLFSCLARQA
jgi:hypothetical protein